MTADAAGNVRRHIGALDGVRAASILLVVAAHTFPLGPEAWNFNGMAGRMGMALFFCLSGYLITSMLLRDQRLVPFMAKRFMRVVPAVFLYLAFLVVFFDFPIKSALINAVFLSNYWTDALVSRQTSHLWSLAIEIHFYIAVSIAVGIGGRRALYLVFPAALVVTALRIDSGVVSNINTHLRVDEILVGGWLAFGAMMFGARLRQWLANGWLAAAVILALSVLFTVSSHDDGGVLTYLRPYLAMLLIGVIMHCNLRWLLDILESRIARYIAKISYALYIWHPIAVFGWMSAGSSFERYVLKRPFSWALSWFAAHISTTFWEAYFQRKTRNILKSRGY